jgi:predicted kinase
MNQVKIMQGMSGAGKSTWVKNNVFDVICSVDDYFMVNGQYRFDPRDLPQAHWNCMRKFIEHVQMEWPAVIVVDNTNTTIAEVAPYYAVAEAYGWDVEIVYIPCEVDKAIARNIHGAPENTIRAMAQRLESFGTNMPPWWNRRKRMILTNGFEWLS